MKDVWIPCSGFIIQLLMHRIFVQCGRSRQKTALAVPLITGLVWCTLGRVSLVGYVNSALLSHLYFHFFNMSETARRIRWLIELHRSPGTDLSTIYPPGRMMELRVQRLEQLGWIEIYDGTVRPKPTWVLWVAHAIRRLEHLLFPER